MDRQVCAQQLILVNCFGFVRRSFAIQVNFTTEFFLYYKHNILLLLMVVYYHHLMRNIFNHKIFTVFNLLLHSLYRTSFRFQDSKFVLFRFVKCNKSTKKQIVSLLIWISSAFFLFTISLYRTMYLSPTTHKIIFFSSLFFSFFSFEV